MDQRCDTDMLPSSMKNGVHHLNDYLTICRLQFLSIWLGPLSFSGSEVVQTVTLELRALDLDITGLQCRQIERWNRTGKQVIYSTS